MQSAMVSKDTRRRKNLSVSFQLPPRDDTVDQQGHFEEQCAARGFADSTGNVVLYNTARDRNVITLSTPNPSIDIDFPLTPSRRRPLGLPPLTFIPLNSNYSNTRYNLAPSIPLTTFHYFRYLPSSVRERIWRWALKALVARTVLVQPYVTYNFSPSAVNREARAMFLMEYTMLHSHQVGRMSGFSMAINYNKDLLYLNRRFVLNPKIPSITSLFETTIVYRHWLTPVKQLALNLKDTLFLLPQAWGQNPQSRSLSGELWDILGTHCPELRLLFLVDYEMADPRHCLPTTWLHPHRTHEWNVRWDNISMSLEAAKVRRIVRQDLVLRVTTAGNITPADLTS